MESEKPINNSLSDPDQVNFIFKNLVLTQLARTSN